MAPEVYVHGIHYSRPTMHRGVERLNALPENEALAALTACCGSRRWVARMVQTRPFQTFDEVMQSAREAWEAMGPSDWIEAFSAHPRIGDSPSANAPKPRSDWSLREQQGAQGVTEDISLRLAEGNKVYEARFGFIFIICATGKSATEMLANLESRLENDSETEILVAAREQLQITLLRIQKLLAEFEDDD